jgi:hypothetical protein
MKHAIAFLLLLPLSAAHAEETWTQDPNVLACSPARLQPGHVLELKLGVGHGKELSVQGPRKEQIFLLVVGSPPSGDPQLMTPREFAAASEATISTDLVAKPWVFQAKPERVFSTPGVYTIRVSENLESEVGGFSCTVKYTG